MGSFELNANEFRKTCGVYLTKHGALEVDIHPPEHSSHHHVHRKDRLAGNAGIDVSYDGDDVVYKRAAESRKRFAALPQHALDRWGQVCRRYYVSMLTPKFVYRMKSSGVEMNVLYRQLPHGVHRIETVLISDLEVLKHYKMGPPR